MITLFSKAAESGEKEPVLVIKEKSDDPEIHLDDNMFKIYIDEISPVAADKQNKLRISNIALREAKTS